MTKFTVIIYLFLTVQGFTQFAEEDLRSTFNSIMFIADSLPHTINYQGKMHEVYFKNPETGEFTQSKTIFSGTGFIVQKSFKDFYLITAKHVLGNFTDNAQISFRTQTGQRKSLKLIDISAVPVWTFHPNADIAVLKLDSEKILQYLTSQDMGAIDYWRIERKEIVPARTDDLLTVGFPLRLGVADSTISPISKKSKPASDLIINSDIGSYFILDDPSVSGFSGAPIFYLSDPIVSRDKTAYLPGVQHVYGLVKGTINDEQDKAGRFAVITPAYQIVDTIDMAPSFSGIYIYKYQNGKNWSKVQFEKGVPWTVFYNYGPNGEVQDMGTLSDGTGTIFSYDDQGKLVVVETFKNGIRESYAPALSTEEFEMFGPRKKSE